MIDFYSIFRKKLKPKGNKPVVLLVLDGWGMAPGSHGNAIAQAKTPNINKLLATYPYGELIASGESVGLPANEVGNTEVGHLTMGVGRVILQDLKRINTSIETGEFYSNQSFLKAVEHTKNSQSKLHIIGLVGSGKVHSSIDHLFALMQFCKSQLLTDVCFHLFTDGRDSPPKEAIDLMPKVEARLLEFGIGRIATISGRYYGMDRDGRWDRTEASYKAIVEGVGNQAATVNEALKSYYDKNLTDEFIEPTIIGTPSPVSSSDSVIFFNFRVDRPRQLTMAFMMPNFENLTSFEFDYVSDIEKNKGVVQFNGTFTRTKKLTNVFFVTMTQYQKNIPVSSVAFPPDVVADPLGFILSAANIPQMRMSESEKERFVTYYFNGMRDEAFPLEDRLIVASPKVATYDRKPEMSVFALEHEFEKVLDTGKYKFFMINFANPDMVAHTGNIEATVKALEATDKAVGYLVRAILEADGTLVITADHGNAEELVTFPAKSFFFTTDVGSINTDHSNNPVPVIFVSKEYTGKNMMLGRGSLSDIAPTILAIMNIPKPATMTGNNLLQNLK